MYSFVSDIPEDRLEAPKNVRGASQNKKHLRSHEKFIIIIIMFLKCLACFLFLDPQDEVGPSISSSVVLCSFVLLVDIVALVLVVCLCPSSVRVVAAFSGTVLFLLLCSVLPCLSNTLVHFFI